jgi:signal transduction histidine kinase
MVILNSLPHLLPWPFLIFTGQGLILYANHSFKNLFVHPPSEGDSLEKIFFKFSPSSIKTWTGKVRIKNGLLKNTKKFLEVIITPDNQDPKQFWLFIKTSSSRARTDRLSLALEKAQQQLEQKSILTANICHEIRNSVSIILGLCEENLEGNLDYKNSPFQKIIYHSAELKNLIQDVLDFSSHEIGGVILEKDSFDPVQVFEDSVILNYPSTQRKNIELVALACPQSPRLVIGDAIKFRRIINNLVGNAIKFTEKGFVHCYLNFKNQGSFCLATLTIDDSGIGISSQHQRKIFAPFTQADDSTAQRFGGHGLGLSIVKELTTAMGGGVKVISKINQGSRFIVTIKWEVNPQMELPQRLDLSDLKILLVGGQSEIQNRLINYFAYCGTQINLAKNNVEAEEMWHTSVSRAQPYTHVLIDLPMDTAPSLPLLPIHKIVLIADRDLHLRDIQHIPKPLTLSALNHFFGRPFNQTVSYNQDNKK